MNILDFAIILILLLCLSYGFHRGLIRTVFSLVSFFAAGILAGRLYPYASRFLRQTALYESLKDTVMHSMKLQNFFREHAAGPAELIENLPLPPAELIESLPLPPALLDLLAANNNQGMYDLLRVTTAEDYIGGFFAHIILNGISMAAIFILALIVMRIIGGALDIIGKLPVINMFNRAGGLAAGFIFGVIVVWVALTLLTLLFATPANPDIYALLQGSSIAGWLFDNNWMLPMLTRI